MAIWEQFAVPYFFAVNFVHQYLMGDAGGKFSMLPAMSPMVGWLVVYYKENANNIYGDIMRNVREKLAETVGKELDNVADNLRQIAEERQKKEECKAILERLSEKIDKLCNEIEAGGAV